MSDFMIRFLCCNFLISIIIGILLITKRVLKNYLTPRMQYNLWLLFLAILALPFIPFRSISFVSLFSWIKNQHTIATLTLETGAGKITGAIPVTENWMNDFTLSVSKGTPSIIGFILSGIWLVGILAMLLLAGKSILRLKAIRNSALPLQNKEVNRLFHTCLNEMNISRDIPVYSTAYLKSPILAGMIKPAIFLPIHLISDYNASDVRFMLLHELQHYRHLDTISNYLMNFAGVLYWFNPLVWYAIKEMRNDREVACDTSVLKMLDESAYEAYGNTLINFAEKVSLTPFPFVAGLSGNMKQMKQRIINIASYEKPSFFRKVRGGAAFGIVVSILFSLAPMITTYGAEQTHYEWSTASEHITNTDFSSYFGDYKGSFVLYDLSADSWNIYNMKNATKRTAPNSTYKIYDALFGLESGIITPESSYMEWNKENYPFETWNSDQNLQSAMNDSVNWYFEVIDQELGLSGVNSYLEKIHYGNESIADDLSSYWMQSSLKISPVEQVDLLKKLYDNSFDFDSANITAVKNSILISSSENGDFYGKTGTGRVNSQDINGWFIGYIETPDNTWFFATNIQNDQNATGKNASEIALSILSDMNVWK